ncbi:MAG: hydroxyphenylacetyl-CoA thioesterase PaaI [Gammaproteobacteria bacterium]|nr:hydroxyphenylacetyl-CoA thioesterase PaaI [Gammaproteobacteria bacterium]NNF50719.1 hydroxyphenylacetyl-CoA thioesterase PaaI [Woeseiaceae bacterium]MBT8094359.1 hydroxyphenylacetyl-CoA thioesterase PaaI [Gammaproteobacteria bacterium]MBT8106563.1 hydroxyphenylacetyl-CoA thioesterase PaaI [Gammaproteobacteria bacterium]NNK26578.1 hydroxyphenylacetyl-CoA thioesterase PaaI [Woeseiaceae bacterium]
MNELDTARRCADTMMQNDRASKALGIRVEIPDPGMAVATMTVRDDMLNGFDVLHGGLTFALADTAFAFACNAYDRQAFAASAQIEFLRPASAGDVLTATASEDHRGRRNGYYSIEVRNQAGELVALFRGRSVSTESALLK